MITQELLVDLDISKLDPAKWIDFPDYGFRQYFLWQNPETGGSVALLDFAEGARVPVKHTHASNQFMYCIEGEYEYTDSNLVLRPGSFYMNPKESSAWSDAGAQTQPADRDVRWTALL